MSEDKQKDDVASADDASEAVETVEVADAGGEGEDDFKFAEDPEFDVSYKGDCAYEVGVKVATANEAAQAAEMFEELKAEASVPGFRKGRAPIKLLEKKFGKSVHSEVTEKLVSASFRKLIKDEDLKPLALPDVDGLEENAERKDGEPLVFTLKFEVAPRCELGKYRGLSIEKPVLKVDEKRIDEAILEMRERGATYESSKKVKAKEGDQVIIDFKGTIDGEAFEGGAAENYPYILGSKRFFSEFEDALKGAKSGDELTCVVNFPDDYSSTALAGKSADFAITVNDLKRKKVPKFDDEFAKQAGFEDTKEMTEKVASDLREGASTQSDRIAETNAVDQIVANSTFELPKSLLDSSASEYYDQDLRKLLEMRVPPATISEREEELRKAAADNAEKNIKGYVVVNEIGEAEGIEVNDEDFEKEAEAIIERTGMEMEVVNRFLEQEGQRDSYESRIFRKKAMDVVMSSATITEKEVSSEELEADDEQQES